MGTVAEELDSPNRAPAPADVANRRQRPSIGRRHALHCSVVSMMRLNDILSKVQAYHPAADLDPHPARATSSPPRRTTGSCAARAIPTSCIRSASPRPSPSLKLDVPSVCAGLLHDCVEDTSRHHRRHLEAASARRSRSSSTASPSSARFRGTTRRSGRRRTSARCCWRWRATSASSSSSSPTASTTCARSTRCPPRSRSASRARRWRSTRRWPIASASSGSRVELEDLSFKYLYPKEYDDLVGKLQAYHQERQSYIDDVSQVAQGRARRERHRSAWSTVGRSTCGRSIRRW